MSLRLALRLFLAAALLAAWQGALVHPLEHFDKHGGLVHSSGAPEKRDAGGADAACDALAAVAACVGGANAADIAVFAHGEEEHAVRQAAAPTGAAAPPYHSQAPPILS